MTVSKHPEVISELAGRVARKYIRRCAARVVYFRKSGDELVVEHPFGRVEMGFYQNREGQSSVNVHLFKATPDIEITQAGMNNYDIHPK